MRWSLLGVIVLSVSLTAWMARAQKPGEAEPSFWMKKKLEFSQHILTGLATADFEKISISASSMNRLGEIEKWSRRTGAEEYRTQLRIFRFANEDLVRAADAKNIDGAALAFSQLTLSCVNCHKVMRDAKDKE